MKICGTHKIHSVSLLDCDYEIASRFLDSMIETRTGKETHKYNRHKIYVICMYNNEKKNHKKI